MTPAQAIDRIKKCLALSASSNEHEAAAALRQARSLMRQHGIGQADIDAAYATEARSDAGAQARPPAHLVWLAETVANAFGCDMFLSRGTWVFVGVDPKPEIATYAYTVLRRQLERDRAAYVATLKRCKRSTKVRRGRVFAQAWIHAVASEVTGFAGTDEDRRHIAAYQATHYPALATIEIKGQRTTRRDVGAAIAGVADGSRVQLRNAVPEGDRPAAIAGRS